MPLDREVVVKAKLIVACIAFSAAANMVQAAEKPNPWAKKFTMSREECSRKMVERRNRIGAGKGHFSTFKGVHDLGSIAGTGGYPPSWVWRCTERYGRL
jgi:hypothetical protein